MYYFNPYTAQYQFHYPFLLSPPIQYFSNQPQFQNTPQIKIEDSSTSIQAQISDHQVKETSLLIEKSQVLAPKQNQKERPEHNDSFTDNRNIIPNNINHILAYVQRGSKSEKLVRKIIKKFGKEEVYSSKGFYCYQKYMKEKTIVHVNLKTLELIVTNLDLHSELFSVDEQLFYNKVCRILIDHYLRNYSISTTLSSARLRETKKNDHLKAQRFIRSHIFTYLKKQCQEQSTHR